MDICPSVLDISSLTLIDWTHRALWLIREVAELRLGLDIIPMCRSIHWSRSLSKSNSTLMLPRPLLSCRGPLCPIFYRLAPLQRWQTGGCHSPAGLSQMTRLAHCLVALDLWQPVLELEYRMLPQLTALRRLSLWEDPDFLCDSYVREGAAACLARANRLLPYA